MRTLHVRGRRLLVLTGLCLSAALALLMPAAQAATVHVQVSNIGYVDGWVYVDGAASHYQTNPALSSGSQHTISGSPYAQWNGNTCEVFNHWWVDNGNGGRSEGSMTFVFTVGTYYQQYISAAYQPSTWYGIECYLGLNTQATAKAYYRTHTRTQAKAYVAAHAR